MPSNELGGKDGAAAADKDLALTLSIELARNDAAAGDKSTFSNEMDFIFTGAADAVDAVDDSVLPGCTAVLSGTWAGTDPAILTPGAAETTPEVMSKLASNKLATYWFCIAGSSIDI
jgi:hypothetical protein